MSSDQLPEESPASGKITSGLEANALVERTIEFVLNELPIWRDDPNREPEEAEERLNAQLCKFLEVAARRSLKMVFFHHEEKQTGTRRVDFSASPTEGQFVGTTFHTIYKPFLVFEGKRLPAPKGQPKREREYVTGGEETSGGIQRFRLGLHGAGQGVAVIVGYIQKGTPAEWFGQINVWIKQLENEQGADGLEWLSQDELLGFSENKSKHVSITNSSHARTGVVSSRKIHLKHLWVKLDSD